MTYAMKDSGIEWIGMFPEHWEVKRLKEIFKGKNTFFKDGDWIESNDISENGIKYLTSGNVGLGFYKEKGKGFISEETFKKLNCSEVFPGDILISRLNYPQGRSCIVPKLNCRIVTAVDNVICRPNEKYISNFLVHLFSSLNYLKQCEIQSTGATMKRISRTKLSRVFLAVPPKKEQEIIASYLDKHVGNLDKYIELAEKKIKLLEEQKTALIYETVTHGLNPDAKMKDSGIEWIGMIPEHWEVKRVKDLFYIGRGRVIAKTEVSKEKIGHNIYPIFSSATKNLGCIGYIDTYDYDKKIITWTTDGINAGTVFLRNGKYNCTNVCGTLYPKKKDVFDINFMSLFLSSQTSFYKRKDINGAKIMNNEMGLIIIGLPRKKQEQETIASYLDTKCLRIEKEIELLKKKVELLKEYKTSLIFEVVTGKKNVV